MMGRANARVRRMLLLSAAAVGAMLGGRSGFGQATDTWVGGVSGNWADANWSGTDNPPLSGDLLVFGPTTSTTVLNDNLTSNTFAIAGITFASPGSSYSISGNALELTGGITNAFSGAESILDAITLGGSETIASTSGGTLDLGGAISGGFGLTITDTSGATILGGSNSYTGGTTFTNGTLDIANASALGVGTLTMSGNTTSFDNTSGAPLTLANAVPILFSGAANSSFTFVGSNSLNTGSGTVTFNTTHIVNLNSGATLTIGGVLAQPSGTTAGVTIQGLGTLALSNATIAGTVQLEGAPLPAANSVTYINANTYMGDAHLLLDFSQANAPTTNILPANALTLVGGNITLNAGGAAGVTQNFGTVTLDGGYNVFNVTGTNPVLVKFSSFASGFENKDGLVNFIIPSNASYVYPSGANESLTFAPSANQSAYIATQNGTMTWASIGTGALAGTITALPTSSYISPTATSSFTSSANIDMSGVPTLTFAASAAAFSLRYNNPQATTITMGPTTTATSVLTIEGGGILMTPAVGANNELITGGQLRGNSNRALRVIQFDPQGTLTIASNITDNVGSGSNAVNIFGNGDVIFSGTNTYDGETQVIGATLSVSSNYNLGVTSINSSTAGTSAPGNNGGTWNTSPNNSVSLDGGVLQALTSFALNNDANNTSGTSDRQIGLAARGGTLDVTTSNTLIVSGIIAGTSLNQIDSGTLAITCPTNTYTGALSLFGGEMNVIALANGGTASSIGASSNAAANLVLAGGDLQYTGAASQSTDHLFTLGASGGSDTATIDASGTGGATLNFTNPGAIAFGDSNPHTLILTGSGAGSLAASIGDANPSTAKTSLTKNGGGVWTLNGNSTFSGPTSINAGQLNLGSGISLGNTAITVSGNASLGVLGNVTIGSGNASVAINPGGTLNLSPSISTLTINGVGGSNALTIGGATKSTLDEDINAEGNSDLIALGGSDVSLGGSILVNLSGNQALGTYPLMTFNNSVSQSTVTSDFTLGVRPPGNNTYSFLTGPGGTSIDLVVGGSAPLASAYWTGAQGSSWSTLAGAAGSSNWSPVSTGSPDGFNVPTAPTNVIFAASNGNRNLSTTLGADFAINSLTFNSTVNSVNIGGANVLTVGSGGITVQNTSGDTISATGDGSFGQAGLFLGAAQTWTTSSGSALDVTAVLGGTGALTVAGSGTVQLANSNTYSSGTTVSGGDLQLGATSALGTGNLIVNSGTVDLNGNSVVTGVLSGAGGVITSMNNNGTLTIGGAASGTFAGSINDDGQVSLVVEGTGKEIFTGNSDYSGGTTINPGATLQLGNGTTSNGVIGNGNVTDNGTLVFANPSAQTFSASVSGTGALVMSGPGTLTINQNNSYTGQTLISGGSLKLGNGDSTALGTGVVNIAAAGLLDLNGNSAQLGSLTGAGTVDNTGGGSNQLQLDTATTTTFAGAIRNTTGSTNLQYNGAGTQILSGVSTYTGGTNLNAGVLAIASDAAINYGIGGLTFNGGSLQLDNYASTLSFSSTNNLSLGAAAGAQASLAAGALSGSTQLTFIGPGTLVLNGANTYTGGTTINGGDISISSDAAVNNGSGSINFGANGTLMLNNYNSNLNFGSGAQLGAAAGAASTLSGAITGGNLTFVGPGTLILKATNGYSNTTVTAGTLQLGAANSLGSGNVAVNAGLLNLNGFGATISDLSGAGTVNDTASGTVTLQLNTNGSATFTGVIENTSGSVALVVSGGGTEVLTGKNTYTGGTTFQGGTLAISADAAINAGTGGYTFSGGNLQLDNYSSTLTFKNISNASVGAATGSASSLASGAISGTTSFTFTGPGTLNLPGTNTFTGGLTINGGALTISSDAAINNGVGGINFNNPGTGVLVLNNYTSNLPFPNGAQLGAATGAAATLASVVSGGNQLLFAGPGTLDLAASNTYSGGTTLSGGTLRMGNLNALGNYTSGNPINFVGPGILDLNGFSPTIAGLASTVTTGTVDSLSNTPVTLTLAGNSTNTFSSVIQNSRSSTGGSLSLVIAAGNQVLSGSASSYVGGTTVLPGAIVTLAGTNGGSQLGAFGSAVNIESGGEMDIATSFQLSLNTYVISLAGHGIGGDGALHFLGASGRLGDPNGNQTASDTITLANDTWVGADNGTFTTGNLLGGFGGGGTLGWTKVGVGVLDLEGTAPYTYTGPTTVAAGELISHETGGTPLTITGDLIIDSGAIFGNDQSGNPFNTITVITVNTNGELDLDPHGNTNFTATAASLNGGGLITASGSAGTATVASGTLLLSDAADTFSGVIQDGTSLGGGPVAFGVTGGTEILTGSNTYSAGTTIGAGGAIQIDDGGTTGTVGTGPVADNGTLILDRGDSVFNFGNIVSGTGAVSMISSTTTVLSGSNSYSGGTIVNSGVLQLGNANAAGAGGPLTVNGGTLDLNGFSQSFAALAGTGGSVDNLTAGGNLTLTIGSGNLNTTYAGAIHNSSGAISLVKVGTGTQTLSGASTYSGPTNVQNGELIVASTTALPSGNNLTIGSTGTAATVQLATLGGTFALGGGLTIASGSTLDVTGNEVLISYTSSDPISTIQSWLADGYAGGKWTGTGITSSLVESQDATQTKLIYDLGYADGGDGITTAVGSGEIEILPTLAGDAKLQGNVVFGDFQVLAQYFGKTGGWDAGNFTYGTTVVFGDYQQLAQDFGSTNGGVTSGELASMNSFAAEFGDALVPNADGQGFTLVSVPEPASVSLLAAAGLGLLARRRRRGSRRMEEGA